MFKLKSIFEYESLVIYGCGLFVPFLATLYFQLTGYPNVVTATGDLGFPTPPIYMIPVFIPFGILLGETYFLRLKKENSWLFLLLECFFITILALLRIFIQVPISGHAVIISLYLLHQVFTNRNQYPFRVLIGILVLIETMTYKIIFWDDLTTLIFGLFCGSGIWFLGFFLKARENKTSNYH